MTGFYDCSTAFWEDENHLTSYFSIFVDWVSGNVCCRFKEGLGLRREALSLVWLDVGVLQCEDLYAPSLHESDDGS